MKNEVHLHKGVPTYSTVMKLALVSGVLLSCVFGILFMFAGAFKVLG